MWFGGEKKMIVSYRSLKLYFFYFLGFPIFLLIFNWNHIDKILFQLKNEVIGVKSCFFSDNFIDNGNYSLDRPGFDFSSVSNIVLGSAQNVSSDYSQNLYSHAFSSLGYSTSIENINGEVNSSGISFPDLNQGFISHKANNQNASNSVSTGLTVNPNGLSALSSLLKSGKENAQNQENGRTKDLALNGDMAIGSSFDSNTGVRQLVTINPGGDDDGTNTIPVGDGDYILFSLAFLYSGWKFISIVKQKKLSRLA
jgi:hypothetical protein